jgi:hypothetical protein
VKFKKKSSDFDPLDMKNKKPTASRRKSTSNYLNEFKVEKASKPKVDPIDENRRPSEGNRISPAKRADRGNGAGPRASARSEGGRGVPPGDDGGPPARVPRPPRSEVPSAIRPSAIAVGGARVRPPDRVRSNPPSQVELSRDDSSSGAVNEQAMLE